MRGEHTVSRRGLLGVSAVGAAVAGAAGFAGRALAKGANGNLPADFLWGAASAGHQVEGGNVSSDVWFLELDNPQSLSRFGCVILGGCFERMEGAQPQLQFYETPEGKQ